MRVFRQKWTRDGAKGETERWYVEIRDAEGRPQRLPAYSDRAASEEYGRKCQRLADLAAAKLPPDGTLTRWIEALDPPAMRERLERIGLLDRERAAQSKPLAAHLDDYKAALSAKGNCAGHITTMHKRVETLFKDCGFKALSDIRADAVVSCLRDMRDRAERPIGVATSNAYLDAARAFCKWAVRNRRMSESVLTHLQPMNARMDVKRRRRALEPDELRRLVEAARTGQTCGGMAGPDRAMLYRVAVSTGFRWSELASLTVGSFDLDAETPTVTVSAAYSKRRREDVQPLPADLAADLIVHFGARLPSARAFNMPKTRMGADMMRADLKAARAAWLKAANGNRDEMRRRVKVMKAGFLNDVDASGSVADFHSLRHSFCTALARGGVTPKLAQDLARHSDINLTLSLYSHTLVQDRAEALDALPNLSMPDADAVCATGTDDCLPSSLPSKRSKRLTSGHNGSHARGIATGAAGERKGSSTLEKSNIDEPLQLVEIAGVEPAASRVRF